MLYMCARFGIVAGILLLHVPLLANQIGLSTTTSAGGGVFVRDWDNTPLTHFILENYSDPTSIALLNQDYGPSSGYSVNLRSLGAKVSLPSAGNSGLAAGVEASFILPAGPDASAHMVASAAFTDVVTVSAEGEDGNSGKLFLYALVAGSNQSDGVANAFGSVFARSGSQSWVQNFENPLNSDLFVVDELDFVFGQPFEIELSLNAIVGTATPRSFGFSLFGTTGAGGGNANFLSTLTLSGFEALDQFGNPISVSLNSSLGANYAGGGGMTPVPEPSSVALLAIGLAGLLVSRRKRRA